MASRQRFLHRFMSVTTACLGIAFSANSVNAQYQGENERRWSASLQSDIRNGVPSDDICRNATSSAVSSDDVDFKNWASSIARQYCDRGFELKEESRPQSDSKTITSTSKQCRLTVSQMNDVGQGIKTMVQANGCFMSFH